MPLTLIKSNPDFKKVKPGHSDYLDIAEMFADTIQGEGINTGITATFLRLQHCTLNCIWCDTTEVWRYGNPYPFEEVFDLMDYNGVIDKLFKGQHLILTGGSPLRQQSDLVRFMEAFQRKYGFKPYIEVENECVLDPIFDFAILIDCWNNSPKLANSTMRTDVRYKPNIIRKTAMLDNSWFKFVIDNDNEWQEIDKYFLQPGLIDRKQIILMPQGQTQDELSEKRQWVVEIAIREGVRYCDRLHVVLWNKKTGV